MSDRPGVMNERADAIARAMLREADVVGVTRSVAACGAAIIDCGVNAPGSPEAGRLYAMACLGGMGSVTLGVMGLGSRYVPSVTVIVNDPARGCLGSQYAGWAIRGGDGAEYFALGSGPARAAYGAEEIYKTVRCAEETDVAVLSLESRCYPPDFVLERVAGCCRVECRNLTVLLAPTASIAGGIQIASRVVETGLHKLYTLGFDVGAVVSGYGTAPVAPIVTDDRRALGLTNDAILYGGRVWYTVDCDDERIYEVLQKLPASASPDFGIPFYDLLARASWSFYDIDPMIFSPACVTINNVRSGRVFSAGRVEESLLEEMWFN